MIFPNIIDPKDAEAWRRAGKLTGQVREYARSIIKEGMGILPFSEAVEGKVKELGATLAFPVNISFNEVAAHDAADIDDRRTFGREDVVKIDIGVSVDGYVGDTAFTHDFSGKHGTLLAATDEALKAAIGTVRAGVTLGEIGAAIEDAITDKGLRPINNLSGHGIMRYEIHTAPTVPNYATGSEVGLEEHMIIAIEPFATDGMGRINESGRALIFSQTASRNVRSQHARKLLRAIEPYKGLPFSLRAVSSVLPRGMLLLAIRELMQQGILRDYPPLVEEGKGLVSQSEHTLLVTKDGCEVLTQA